MGCRESSSENNNFNACLYLFITESDTNIRIDPLDDIAPVYDKDTAGSFELIVKQR